MTLDEKLDYALKIAGTLIALMSIISSLLNHVIRVQTSNGGTPGKTLTGIASVMNFLSVNLDKAVQFAKMTMGKQVPQTVDASSGASKQMPPDETPKPPSGS